MRYGEPIDTDTVCSVDDRRLEVNMREIQDLMTVLHILHFSIVG